MPKIIEGAQENILAAAKSLLFEEGYEKLTIRAVAKTCGIAPGTVYNYYADKEFLMASIMLEDWTEMLAQVQKNCAAAKSLREGLRAVYDGLMDYQKPYRSIWSSYRTSGPVGEKFQSRHQLLVSQLSGCIRTLLLQQKLEEASEAEGNIRELFLAENLLLAANESYEFDDLAELLENAVKGG